MVKAIVVLDPVRRIRDTRPCSTPEPDEFTRTITLTPESPVVVIGRTSKSTGKKRVAEENNCFITSPVLSRQHAKLEFLHQSEPPKVIMKDTGSMHGTLVNGTKVQSDKESVLEQGQTFVFGTEVHTTRDDDVHYPPQFRVASLDIIRESREHHAKPRNGYGLDNADLFEDEYDDETNDLNDMLDEQCDFRDNIPLAGQDDLHITESFERHPRPPVRPTELQVMISGTLRRIKKAEQDSTDSEKDSVSPRAHLSIKNLVNYQSPEKSQPSEERVVVDLSNDDEPPKKTADNDIEEIEKPAIFDSTPTVPQYIEVVDDSEGESGPGGDDGNDESRMSVFSEDEEGFSDLESDSGSYASDNDIITTDIEMSDSEEAEKREAREDEHESHQEKEKEFAKVLDPALEDTKSDDATPKPFTNCNLPLPTPPHVPGIHSIDPQLEGYRPDMVPLLHMPTTKPPPIPTGTHFQPKKAFWEARAHNQASVEMNNFLQTFQSTMAPAISAPWHTAWYADEQPSPMPAAAESSKEQEHHLEDDSFGSMDEGFDDDEEEEEEDDGLFTEKPAGKEPVYTKAPIEAVMNRELSQPLPVPMPIDSILVAPASPPMSEEDSDEPEPVKADEPVAASDNTERLDDMKEARASTPVYKLATPASPPPSLKRKREASVDWDLVPQSMRADRRAAMEALRASTAEPMVVDNLAKMAAAEAEAEDNEQQPERPAKRPCLARRVAGTMTTLAVGAVFGGIAMFATLVASAE
ncbi:Similar to Uncharacterized protein C3H7.13; acc. no. O74388 [Pyronema omphalodes CBS 100304]|uniref:Similar to Uncharacterized protein C3H7.13 acc. no. O74388 n=1 Tax=Pyronema omphalodes (strain CBS 100304) TaxID=1076935 RepID=U4L5Z2_PYROM|nr:Similar to Uncharacterized protein C3H7.13; acc. no. O74388 [Pyronema omphalodes CBS 100304]